MACKKADTDTQLRKMGRYRRSREEVITYGGAQGAASSVLPATMMIAWMNVLSVSQSR
jgi:hypothetical protein